jgi:hypothetical protein
MRCVPAHDFTVAKALLWRSAIDDGPPYQREGSIWSLEKQQLFIDSLLNGYDVPKIYLHDVRGRHPTKVYAVVDGKQRLSTIWRFLTDQLELADDFRAEPGNLPELPPETPSPAPGSRFSQMHPLWQEVLKSTFLAVVLIQNATEHDIEDLFSRLNNGEPLNEAERRNAMGGTLPRLVRELVRHEFFTSRVQFSNDRYQHHDAAARLLLIEHAAPHPTDPIPDLHSRSLDSFVNANRRLSSALGRELARRTSERLDLLSRIFAPSDPLLRTQAHPPLYYLMLRSLGWRTDQDARAAAARSFLDRFNKAHCGQPSRPEREPVLTEFGNLMQHGGSGAGSLKRRVEILTEYFSREHPELVG